MLYLKDEREARLFELTETEGTEVKKALKTILEVKIASQLFENGTIELQLMAQLNLLMTQLNCNSNKI